MEDRSRRALSLAAKVGLIMAVLGFLSGLAAAITEHVGWLERLAYVTVIPLGSFALFFALVWPLGYAFPPAGNEPTLGLRFAHARRIIWPVVILGSAVVLYLVLRHEPR